MIERINDGRRAYALQTQHEHPGTYEGLAFAGRLQLLVDQETQERRHRKQERLILAAQFKLKAPMPKGSTTSIPEACSRAKWPPYCSVLGLVKHRICCSPVNIEEAGSFSGDAGGAECSGASQGTGRTGAPLVTQHLQIA